MARRYSWPSSSRAIAVRPDPEPSTATAVGRRYPVVDGLIKKLMVLCLALLLAGCDPFAQPDTLMDEYLERVGRVLDLQPDSRALPAVTPLPRRRQRVRELPELDMGILEFFSLYGCELQQVVGEKNSALGKVMQPAQRLDYEIRFIAASADCLPVITDESLQADLAAAARIKREALPLAVWNATWGAPEMAKFYTRSDGYLPLTPDPEKIATLAADLDRLNGWIRDLHGQTNPTMFEPLSEIHQRWQALPVAGQLIQSSRLLIARLNDVESLLSARLAGRPLCFNQRPNADAEIMRNLFFNVYAARVQPYMAEVQRVRARLLPLLQELALAQRPAMSPAFMPFMQALLEEGPGSLWGRLDQAVQDHTERWQELLDQCGMRPQA